MNEVMERPKPADAPTETVSLLPCPFCGSTPAAKQFIKNGFAIGCHAAACGVWPEVTGTTLGGAAAAWNRRSARSVPDDVRVQGL